MVVKNKLGDRMIKHLLNSVIAKISRFASVSYINYLPQPSASANNNLLATDKSRYFAQPRPIIVICPITRKQVGCVIGLVHSVLYVSDRQVKYSAGIQITEVF